MLLVVLPPALLLAIELLLGLIGAAGPQAVAHIVFLGALAALIAAQALKKSIDASDVVLIALSVAVGRGASPSLWARAEPVRSFLNVLSPVPLVFLLLFLFSGQISELAFPSEAKARTIGGVARAPIVVVLLDELPSNTLVDENDRLDAKRFPGFGELARNATWFRNAYTVYDSTERAQPAIMDGNLPERDKQPISSDHPNSIFSLFAKTHRMNVDEEATNVCSRDLCTDSLDDESYGEPDLVDGRGPRARVAARGLAARHRERPRERVRELGQLRRRRRDRRARRTRRAETTNMLREPEQRPAGALPGLGRPHRARTPAGAQLQAHAACRTCPGSTCPRAGLPAQRRTTRSRGSRTSPSRTRGSSTSLLQRHFLQTGFADYELQQLWKRLKAQGLWDESLIVVAADHGVAFPQARERRRLSRETAREIAPIPLFIKAPGQTEGEGRRRLGRDDRHPADDLRRAEPRPAREDGRQVGVQRRGAEPRRRCAS